MSFLSKKTKRQCFEHDFSCTSLVKQARFHDESSAIFSVKLFDFGSNFLRGSFLKLIINYFFAGN